MTEHRCVTCPQLRAGEPRIYERAQCCEGCRSRLRAMLAEVVDLYAGLTLEKGSTGGAKVSGSRTPPLPLAVATLDLTMPAHLGAVQDGLHDQLGDISAATILDSWATDWQTYRWALLPAPTVPTLVGWLTDRLVWACDEHPAIDDFAAELNGLVRRLRPPAPRAELKTGVPCRECEKVTLYRWPGSDYIECGSCDVLMTPEEFTRWVQLITMPAHQPWVLAVATRESE